MKYLKKFENNSNVDFLKDKIENAIAPKMKVFDDWSINSWDILDDDSSISFEIWIETPEIDEEREFIDDGEFFEKMTIVNPLWSKIRDYMRQVVLEIPSLLPDYFAKDGYSNSVDNGIYFVNLEYTDEFAKELTRADNVGLWDLKTKK